MSSRSEEIQKEITEIMELRNILETDKGSKQSRKEWFRHLTELQNKYGHEDLLQAELKGIQETEARISGIIDKMQKQNVFYLNKADLKRKETLIELWKAIIQKN